METFPNIVHQLCGGQERSKVYVAGVGAANCLDFISDLEIVQHYSEMPSCCEREKQR